MTPKVAIVVPCLNEEEVLPATDRRLQALLEELQNKGLASKESYILYVDDGSTDSTWETISRLSSPNTRGIMLSRNFGHQEALLAGMGEAVDNADAIITIDADLQDDCNVIPEMLRRFIAGDDIVYGVRNDRHTDSRFKRLTAHWFYRFMKSMGVNMVFDHADFRLMSSRAAAHLLEFDERNLFLRGIVPMLGYEHSIVTYERKERTAGTTKYPLAKMLEFAVNGITSFSVRPVRMLFWIGTLFMLTAMGVGIYVLFRYFSGATIEGWTSLMLSIWFCTGVLLMGLGVIGEYVGKIYIEVKKRPRYKIRDRI